MSRLSDIEYGQDWRRDTGRITAVLRGRRTRFLRPASESRPASFRRSQSSHPGRSASIECALTDRAVRKRQPVQDASDGEFVLVDELQFHDVLDGGWLEGGEFASTLGRFGRAEAVCAEGPWN